MTYRRSLLAFLAFVSAVATAQVPPPGAAPRVDVVALLDLDSERSELVRTILKQAYERMRMARAQIGPPTSEAAREAIRAAMRAIGEDADQRLGAVITVADLANLEAKMAQPGFPRLGGQQRQHPDQANSQRG
jgi:hypothetical protein